MKLEAHKITYQYPNKNIGNANGNRSTIIFTATDGKHVGISELYAAAYDPVLCGMIVDYILANRTKDYHLPFCSDSGLVAMIINCIEIAEHDLALKAAGSWISITPGRRTYYSGGSMALSPDEIRQECHSLPIDAKGYKLRVGANSTDEDLARVEAACSELGSTKVAVDFIANTLQRTPIDLLNNIDKTYRLLWIEEPWPANNVSQYYEKRLNNMVIAGEWATCVGELATLCSSIDCIQVDAAILCPSNFSDLEYISQSADVVVIHSWGSNIQVAMGKLAEYVTARELWYEQPLINSELNDHLEECDRGIGINIDMDWLKHASKRMPQAFKI